MMRKEALRKFISTHTHHLSMGAFLVGFIFDNFTLPRIDNPVAHFVIFSYLSLAGAAIMLSGFLSHRRHPSKFFVGVALFLPPFIQFVFGGLFSALFVYYFRSASLFGSWAFFLILFAVIVGNEAFRASVGRFPFQLALFFAALFGSMIFYLPIFFTRLDGTMFFLSGAVSLVVMAIFVICMLVTAPLLMHEVWKRACVAIVGIFLCLNLLYVTKSIPPIPLVLVSADVYHDIAKNEAETYVGKTEDRTWYDRTLALAPEYHFRAGESVYFYSAIFAPAAFSVPIYHEWQYRDEERGEWVTGMRVPFSIYGGRAGGYRGYSIKYTVTPGRWRVLVKTANGQLLGQRVFTIVPAAVSPKLYEKEL